jgi:hypothetical protein
MSNKKLNIIGTIFTLNGDSTTYQFIGYNKDHDYVCIIANDNMINNNTFIAKMGTIDSIIYEPAIIQMKDRYLYI